MIKAVFFDVDGTLLSFKTKRISTETFNTLQKLRDKGIKLFIATGRGMEGLYVVDDFLFDGYITLNGQCCYDANKNFIYEEFLLREDVETILKEAKEHNYSCAFSFLGGKIFNHKNELVKEVDDLTGNEMQPDGDLYALDLDRIYMSMTFVNEQEEVELLKKLKKVTAARWHKNFCDITSAGVSKAKGVEYVLKHFNIAKEEAMAFGDGNNDLALLKSVGIGVAMGDGNQQLKEEADYITDSIDEDGITKACLHFKLL